MKWMLALFGILGCFLIAAAAPTSDEVQYLSPSEMVFSPDGRWLYVICEKGDQLLMVDVQSRALAKRVAVGHVPRGLAISADGRQLYVANSWNDNVFVIDARTLELVKTVATGVEPYSVVPDHEGKILYVANRLSSDVSVIDAQSGQEIKRLAAGHGASYLAESADGKTIYATHVYPKLGRFRKTPESEITVISGETQRVIDRTPLPNVAGVFHIALSADGRFGAAAQLRPKNLIPLAHVEHGSVFANSLTIFGADVGGVVQVPIDELDRYFAMPFGVVITPDKARMFVTTGGSDSVTVIDIARLLTFVRAHPKSFANDLAASANYVVTRIPVGRNPRGITLSPDGNRLYVSNRMDDNISVIDIKTNKVISTIDLGTPKKVTPLRKGEQIFYTTKYSFQGQFSCANCHIDVTFDGLQWDLEPDGFGVDVVDNRSMEDLMGTEPFKWNGGNPDLPTECGPRTEKYFYRSQSYNEQELTDLVTFIFATPVRPNRFRLPNGELTPAQERGKAIFERTRYKSGKPIPETNQCGTCHSGRKYTNQKLADVGTGKPTDRSPLIDTPHLPNVAYSAPYLHDGSAKSLEEIWTVFNPKDQHGVSNDLTKDELNDLIEYLRTL